MLEGSKLSRYEIRKKIGAGGMGEVYLAYDEQLHRLVALKILPPAISFDENRQKRFQQEARAVSALNHPNIITIYEINEVDEQLFIATEFIDGETLRDDLDRSSLSIARAVKIAEQIADALAAAHEAHIVHRDIKPENVMIRRDSFVKILDFGLAKPTGLNNQSSSEDVTKQILNTTPGMIMGSVRYMSPEQARGMQVDERTDIWSLGAVLYEMVTGHSPFQGETTSDALAALIYKEPEQIVNFVPDAPAELQRIIRKALKKDRNERYQNIKDLALDLKSLLFEIQHEISLENQTRPLSFHSGDINVAAPIHRTGDASRLTQDTVVPTSDIKDSKSRTKPQKWLTAKIIFSSVALFGVLGLVVYWWVKGNTNFTATAFQKTQISRLTTDGKALFPAMSPDGKYIAFVSGEIGNRGLLVRQVATNSSVTLIPHSPLGFKAINFSPDGNYVYYTQTSPDYTLNTLYQIPTLGGTPKKLIEDVDSPVSFSPDAKRLTFMRQNSKDETDQIFTANSDGSNLQLLTETRTTGFNKFTAPAWSPDGTKMMVGAIKNPGDNNAEVVLMEISAIDGSLKPFSEKKWDSIDSISWFKDGSGFLMTARELESTATQILRVAYPSGEIQPITNDLNNYFGLAISSDGGTLVTVQGNAVAAIWNYNPETKEQNQLMPENPGLDGDWGISQAPDGKIVFTRKNGRECNLWEVDPDGKNARQLTSESRINNNPLVTPDGRYILFVSNRSGNWRIWRMERDGKNPVQLSEGDQNNGDFNPEIMPDSKTVIFQRSNTGSSKGAIMKISIDGGEITTLLSSNQLSYDLSSVSPDGKRIVFREFNPASYEKKIVVASLDGNSLQIEKTIPPDFVSLIYWSPDSKSLTFSSGEGIVNIWRMSLDGKARLPLTDFKAGRIHSFSWSNDGKNLFISRGIYNNDLVLIRDAAKNPK